MSNCYVNNIMSTLLTTYRGDSSPLLKVPICGEWWKMPHNILNFTLLSEFKKAVRQICQKISSYFRFSWFLLLDILCYRRNAFAAGLFTLLLRLLFFFPLQPTKAASIPMPTAMVIPIPLEVKSILHSLQRASSHARTYTIVPGTKAHNFLPCPAAARHPPTKAAKP